MRNVMKIFIGVLMTASAATAQTAVRANDNLNVRTGPGVGYSAFGLMPSGSVYCGLSQSGGFWKIQYDNRTGWVNGSYCSTLSGQTGVKVTDGPLNVRSGPSTGYSILGSVNVGQVFWWITSSGGWYKVHWNGRTGWLSGTCLTRVNLAGGGSTTTTTTTTTSTSGTVNLNMQHFVQVNGYFCGPTTIQMVAKYLTGITYNVYSIASYIGCGYSGTYNGSEASGLKRYASSSYYLAYTFNRSVACNNINRSKPVPINFNCRYLAYWNGFSGGHYSAIRGYTSGGFYINDVGKSAGANKWASSTEVYNAVNYWHSVYYRIY